MHAHPVATLQGIRRQFEISRQAAIVREQQQAFAVQVEPADADHARKPGRQMGKHRRTIFFVAHGGHQTGGLVIQKQARRFRGRQRSAVHENPVVWPNGERRCVQHFSVDAHAPVGNPPFGIAARAQSSACDDLGDALGFSSPIQGVAANHHGFTESCDSEQVLSSACFILGFLPLNDSVVKLFLQYREVLNVALGDLLARGYFPKELPSPFVTVPFANALGMRTPLPADFAKSAAKGNTIPTAKVGRYSLARAGLFRRPLSICNPLPFFLLSKELMQNWATIGPVVSGSPLAATAPDFKLTGRAIDGKWPQGARSDFARDRRLGMRYVLLTDINRFYGSIYTHSIAWALHGKLTAKSNRSLLLLGNKIDYWVRMGQDQQTIGIPIGPDPSLVLAELIMHRCDDALLSKLPQIKGYRFIDDYELSFRTRTEAEDAYHILESCLSEYELTLNAKKTEILESPLPLEKGWVTELKLFSFRATPTGQAADLSNYFSSAFSLHNKYPDDAVLQFAIARLRSLDIDPANWSMFQQLLLLCVIPEPATLPYVLEQIIIRKNAGAGPILGQMEEIANDLIQGHSNLKHSSEVANALWACLALQLQIGEKAVDAVSLCDDRIVALLALDCEQHGLLSKALDKSLWNSFMTAEALYDEHWLLAYEANYKGWLPSVDAADHVAADPNFGFLKSQNVSFYDQSRAAAVGTAPIPLPSIPTIATFAGSIP